MWPPCRSRRRPWYLRGPRALLFCFEGSCTNLKNRKPISRRHVVWGTAQSPHGHLAEALRWSCSKRTIFQLTCRQNIAQNSTAATRWPRLLCATSARKQHGLPTISVRRARRLHGYCTDIARFPYNLRAASVRICPGLPPRANTSNGTMLLDNVNTHIVASFDAPKIARQIVNQYLYGARGKYNLGIRPF